MKYRSLMLLIAGLILWPLMLRAQDTITVEVDDNTKILICVKDKQSLEKLKELDINQIIKEVTSQMDTLNDKGREKVYEYSYNSDTGKYTLESTESYKNYDSSDDSNWDFGNENFNYRRTYKRYRFFWAVDLGLNNYLENGAFPDETGKAYGVRTLGSRYFGLGTYGRFRVGGSSSPFSVQTGLELSVYNFVFQRDNYIVQTETGVEYRDYFQDFERGLIKSKLTVPYINIPLTLNLRFKNKQGRRTFNFGAGGYVGYRLDSYSKVKFERRPDRTYSNFFLNNWRYGMEFHAGYRDVLLFFKYDMNEFFSEGRGPQLNAFTFGIRI